MSDLFISYAREDRPRAELLAKVLTRHGWSVWWDRRIPVGKTFAQVIEEQIRVAKCVIVLWSKAAVKSDWVHNEAAEGQQRGILAPVFIEEVSIPFEFRRIQAARLVNWNGESDSIEFSGLLEAIERIIGRRDSLDEEPPTVKEGRSQTGVGTQAGEKRGHTEGPKPEHTALQFMASFFPLTRAEKSVWLQWMLATTLGWAVGGVVGGAVIRVGFGSRAVAWAVGAAVAGVIVGTAQWFVLKQQFAQSGWWILASALGWAVSGAMIGAAIEAGVGFVIGAVAGVIVGTAQWFVLKQQFAQSGWWILASALGWAVGWAVPVVMDRIVLSVGWSVFSVVGWAVPVVVGGTITGTVLIRLFRHPISKT